MDYREKFNELKVTLVKLSPYLFTILLRLRVIKTKNMPAWACSTRTTIYLSEDFFKLSFYEQLFVLAHEIFHIILGHTYVIRSKNIKRGKYNIAADVVVNERFCRPLFRDVKISIPIYTYDSSIVSMSLKEKYKELFGNFDEKKYKEWTERLSSEEIYNYLPDIPDEDVKCDLSVDDYDGEELQPGDEELEEAFEKAEIEENPDILKEAINKIVREAEIYSKIAGMTPLGIEEVLSNILKPKLPWNILLKQYIYESIRGDIYKTYTKPNRRIYSNDALLPWHIRLSLPRIIVLVDSSGSIGMKELEQFFAEIEEMKKHVQDIIVGCWDVEFYGFQKYNTWRDIKIKGGGGTNPDKALKEAMKIKRPGDIVVILTDGDWCESRETLSLLRRANPIIVTTHRKVHPEIVRNIKIDIVKYPY